MVRNAAWSLLHGCKDLIALIVHADHVCELVRVQFKDTSCAVSISEVYHDRDGVFGRYYSRYLLRNSP